MEVVADGWWPSLWNCAPPDSTRSACYCPISLKKTFLAHRPLSLFAQTAWTYFDEGMTKEDATFKVEERCQFYNDFRPIPHVSTSLYGTKAS